LCPTIPFDVDIVSDYFADCNGVEVHIADLHLILGHIAMHSSFDGSACQDEPVVDQVRPTPPFVCF